jgi:hypothetical protein
VLGPELEIFSAYLFKILWLEKQLFILNFMYILTIKFYLEIRMEHQPSGMDFYFRSSPPFYHQLDSTINHIITEIADSSSAT